MRALEMQASAHLFDAGLVQETLPNAAATVDDARTKWVAAAGSEDALIERIAQVMRSQAIDTLRPFCTGANFENNRAPSTPLGETGRS